MVKSVGQAKNRGWTGLWMVVLVALVAGCATAPEGEVVQPWEFDAEAESASLFVGWLNGEDVDVDDPATAEEAFLAGEASYWEGDWEQAYRWYVRMLREHPGHALNRYAAARLMRLRNDIVDFSSRMARDLQGVRFDDETALTRVELARLSFEVARDDWSRSEVEEPFSFRHSGVFLQWRATPALSPWRLLDFDVPFGPEEEPRLADDYRSPQFTNDDVANRWPTRKVVVDGPRRSLQLGSRGVYYLESQLVVEGEEAREVTLSGRFPGAARVWIDGEEVFERHEEGYESGRLLRRVTLEPGEHRVLVKLAYRPGSRDWVELFAVPLAGEVLGDAGVYSRAEVDTAGAGMELGGPQQKAEDLEPVRIDGGADGDGALLYLAALSAYMSGDSQWFSWVWEDLMEVHPDFVPGYILPAHQAQTRWDLPSESRDATTLSNLRRAQDLSPENLYVLVELERRLGSRASDRERRELLERARDLAVFVDGLDATGASIPVGPDGEILVGDVGASEDPDVKGKLRQLRPLIAWARYLDDEGWSDEAESAWGEVLGFAPGNCEAIRAIQRSYRSRHYFPEMEEISPKWRSCTSVVQRWLSDHPDRLEERVDEARRQARRYPYSVGRLASYADSLRAVGRNEEAVQVLDEALERLPDSHRLWEARIERAVAEGQKEEARALIERAIEVLGRNSNLEWQKVHLGGEIPLMDLMRDGRQAALEEVRRRGLEEEVDEEDLGERSMVLDDAYFVVDFAARHYMEDGSSWMLTHQVTRAMTRGSIDRFAEMTVPRGAKLLKARTIKQNGDVLVPDGMSGDSTFSMPGLEEGDMVEVAYLQFYSGGELANHIDGGRFFFQMTNISSRHSEYVVIGPDDLEFESANGAPEPERFEYQGRHGWRFVKEDSRRPRSEPRRVSAQEYLPWVREVRVGVDAEVMDTERRYMKETIRGSTRPSPKVYHVLEEWLGRPIDSAALSDDDVRALFYGAAAWFRNISPGSFSTDAAHALERRRGSPHIVLHLALSMAGVDNEIYLARSDEFSPIVQTVGELGRYRETLLRVVMPDSGEVKWLHLTRRDAMFGAVEPEFDGQDAVCITCETLERDTVAMKDELRPRRHIDVSARLAEDGTLSGTLEYEFYGARAERVRSALRDRPDEADRMSYFERVVTDQLSGADVMGYEVFDEAEPDRPLRFVVEFERHNFARPQDGGLVVDQSLFREAMQRIYARPASRTTAMFVGYERVQSYSVDIELPRSAKNVDLRAVDVTDADTRFGGYERRSWMEDGVFHMESAINLPRQRVQAVDYLEFREWTRAIEESGQLWMYAEIGGG